MYTPFVLKTNSLFTLHVNIFFAQANSDIRLSGHVSSVGRSSIETTVWLEQEQQGQWMKLTSAVFLMAARNTDISGSAPVNKLVPSDEEEKLILAEANGKFVDRLNLV